MSSRSPTGTLLRPPSFHPILSTPGIEWMPTDGRSPKYYVINPMHIVTLTDRSKSFGVRCVEKIKAISEKWFTHILLLVFLIGYVCLGAVLFRWLENPLESRVKFSISKKRTDITHFLWYIHENNYTEHQWKIEAENALEAYGQQIYESYQYKIPYDSDNQWTFWGSMFYCCTVVTTIGYGNIAPSTTAGRAVTIVYAFIGIPFLLMVLADLGKLFTRTIKALFYYIRLFYHTGSCRKVRRAGRRATAIPAQFMQVAWRAVPNPSRTKSKRASINNNNNKDVEANKEKETDSIKEKGVEAEQDIMSYTETLPSNYYDIDDEFNLPVSLALVILLGYMMLGAFLFTLWEDWKFFESFYFVFISMSTIGFGDYVPEHPKYMMATFIYLLFGLALTSMCINIIQEKLSATFQKARLHLGNTFGLDIANMAEEEESKDVAEVHGKNKSRSGSKSDNDSPHKTDKETIANGKTDHKDKNQSIK